MKLLPETFRKDGFDFKLVRREGRFAIYTKTKPTYKTPSFEVGVIRRNKARTAFGRDFEDSESWPSSEEWGVRAWTYTNLDDSVRRLESLCSQNARKAKSPEL